MPDFVAIQKRTVRDQELRLAGQVVELHECASFSLFF